MPNVFAASTATLLWGLMPWAPSPAMSSQAMGARRLSLNYETGQVTATAEINPLARRLLGRVLKKEVPSTVEFSATDLAGQVAIPAGKAEFLDGAIAIDAAPLLGIMAPAFERALASAKTAYNLPQGLTPTQLEAMFRYEFVGAGTLSRRAEAESSTSAGESNSLQTTQFVFGYDDRTGVISAQGIDPGIWQACQVETCTTVLDGTLDVDLDVDAVLQTSEGLDISLPSTVKRVLRNALFWGVESLDFASGRVNSRLMTQPNSEPAMGWITRGNFVLNAHRSTVPWSAVFSIP